MENYYTKKTMISGVKQLTLLITLLLGNLYARAQAPAKLWDKTIGGKSNDELVSLQQTSDGGYILGGSSVSGIGGDKTQGNKGGWDYWLVKLDANGTKTWDKTIGGTGRDVLTTMQQTSDEGYILGGYSWSGSGADKTQGSEGFFDYWVVKLDASGVKQWDKTFGGPEETSILNSLQQTSDGGYILGGYSYCGIGRDKTQANLGYSDYWIIKLDASGNKMWDKTYGGSDRDDLSYLQQTLDGGYILGGYSESGITGDKTQASKGGFDYWVVKLDPSGNKTWDKTIGGSSNDYLSSLQQTSDGGYILGGYSGSGISGDKTQASKGGFDYWVVKLDASGNKTWDKTIGGSDNDYLSSLRQTSEGGYILGGYSESGISGDKTQASKGVYDYWVVKLDASGNKTWDKTIGGSDNDYLSSLRQTSEGGYILGGSSYSRKSGDKTQANKGKGQAKTADYWVVKLGNPVQNAPTTSGSGSDGNVLQVYDINTYPNPFTDNLMLELTSEAAAETAKVTLTSIDGKTVYQKEVKLTNGRVSEELDGLSKLPAGMYFLMLHLDEKPIVLKVMKH